MKKVLISAALILGLASVSMAADLGSVGTTGVEAVTDYTYVRSLTGPYSADHTLITGVQGNDGALGSLAVQAGDNQAVTKDRLNSTDFSVTYANGVKLGKLSLVADVNYSVLTSDKWIGGHNDTPNQTEVSFGGEANLNLGTFKPFVDYSHATQNVENTESVGSYIQLTKAVSVKVGYSRFSVEQRNYQGGVASLYYKF
jgi:hypothetical protein